MLPVGQAPEFLAGLSGGALGLPSEAAPGGNCQLIRGNFQSRQVCVVLVRSRIRAMIESY